MGLPHISLEIIPQPQLSLLQTSARMQPWLIIRNTSPALTGGPTPSPINPPPSRQALCARFTRTRLLHPKLLQRSLFNSMESSTFSESDNRAGPSQCVTAEQKTYLSAILISSGQYTIPYPIDFPCLSFLKRLLSQSHNRRLLNMNSICDEYIYFAKVNWNHLSERRYEAPYTPGDSASYITPTRRDWSPKFATRLIPRKSDQFPGLFDDFYFLGAGSP
ncbi:hypothetical protein MJO29_007217, partial [Puccinia striiformis f. sp. tritici]